MRQAPPGRASITHSSMVTPGGHIHWVNWACSAHAANTRSRGASKMRMRRRVVASRPVSMAFPPAAGERSVLVVPANPRHRKAEALLVPPLGGGVEQVIGATSKGREDRKSTRLNSSHPSISYAVFCLKKKKK